MMWDSPLYVVNMFYYHWLINKLLWPMAWQNIVSLKIQAEIEEDRNRSPEDTM